MTQEGFKRKLTAILSADVAGYSRLMGENETATVKTLAAYREIMTLRETMCWLNLRVWWMLYSVR
jgi:class 3 adenylate cyclase